MKKFIIPTMLVFLVLFLGCSKRTERPEHLKVGEPLPGFFTHTIDGHNVSTAGLLGKPSVIVFFSTTCPDCHLQLPEIEYAYRNYMAQINFLVIARDEDEATVKTFWNQAGYTMPVAAPGNRDIYNLFDRDSGSGVPQVYICDKDGIVTSFANDKMILFADDLYGILHSLLEE